MGLVGLAVGLQVDVGLCGVFNGAVAAVWAAFPLLRLSARSRLEHVDKAAVKPWILWIFSLIKSHLNVESTNLSSSVRPRSWLRLRLIGYTLGTRVRSLVICLNLSSLRRWDWPGWQSDRGDCEESCCNSPVVLGCPVPIGLLYSDLSNNNKASFLKYTGQEIISFRLYVFDILDNIFIVNPLLPRGQWFQEEKGAFTGNDNFRTLIMCHSVWTIDDINQQDN